MAMHAAAATASVKAEATLAAMMSDMKRVTGEARVTVGEKKKGNIGTGVRAATMTIIRVSAATNTLHTAKDSG